MIVAQNIARLMERRGTNGAELARAAKLNTAGVYDILTGRSGNPRVDTLDKIAHALHVPLAELLEDREQSRLREDIIDAVSSLPHEEQKRILLTARAWSAARS